MNRNILKNLLVCLLFFSTVFTVSAQQSQELVSPCFFGLGQQSSSLDGPIATIFNPAAMGLEQRIRVSLNYIGLFGSDDNDGLGTSVYAGTTIPTSIGVFTFVGGYSGSDLASATYGSMGTMKLSFSKDLFPNLLVGLGIAAFFGSQNDESDWGLGADLGFIHILGDLAFIKDFTWGFAFRNLGKGYAPVENGLLPAAFTPALSMNMKFLKTDPLTIALFADLSSPGFTNFVVYTGLDLTIFKIVTAKTSFHYDVNDAEDSAFDRFPLSFALSFKFNLNLSSKSEFLAKKGWAENEMAVSAAFAPLADGAVAAGAGVDLAVGKKDKNPPRVDIKPISDQKYKDDDVIYVSPNLDGIQDNLELKIDITDERYVKGYRVKILDKDGNEVRVIENKETREENMEIANMVDRLLYKKKGILIPESISWDGKNTNGTAVGDGKYTYVVEAWDDNGNTMTTEPKNVEIDSKAPEAEITAEYTIFSPNGDGNKDALPLDIEGSEEDVWTGEVLDSSDNVVSTFEWKGKPENLSWEGTDKDGKLLPDGVYSVAVSSTDRAGNTATTRFDNIIINTQETPIFITVDKTIFSPNGDGNTDAEDFNIILGNREGIKSWKLEMIHEASGVQRAITGGKSINEKITWDGKDNGGKTAIEGMYNAQLTVEYVKGDMPVEISKQFRLDVTPPEVDLVFSPEPFSPDNDGVEDDVKISAVVDEPSGVADWTMEIKDPKGAHFTSFSGTGTPSKAIIWNGISDKGELVQAASDYTLELTISDSVGNTMTMARTLAVDVLVIRDGDKLYIRVPSITFKPNTADYKSVAAEAFDKNMWTIDRLVRIFKKYKSYQIQIEGHAVSVYWRDEARSKKEQIEELIPLSKSRAEAIKQALVEMGIEEYRISTIGVGADRPLFPFSDEDNLWKNRRVEFILLKK
ncbi:MAG: OmpA family protein [Spirochaetales bacterium]|nr:OmpA family protein [Spirochaetales bacterium]